MVVLKSTATNAQSPKIEGSKSEATAGGGMQELPTFGAVGTAASVIATKERVLCTVVRGVLPRTLEDR